MATKDVDLRLSLMLHTRYILDERLGKGSSGTVVSAHRRKHAAAANTNTKPCSTNTSPEFEYHAIKIFPRHKRHYFNRELSALDLLRGHDNIVQIHSSITSKDHNYIIMEECDGDLDHLVSSLPKIDEDSAKFIFKQMVVGLIAVHLNGICHHDVKLDNFLIGKDGSIKLADFGYSLPLDDRDYILNISGKKFVAGEYAASSPAYSSYQVLTKQPHSPHLSDIYSLGVCLYRILTGYFPFCRPKEDTIEILMENVGRSKEIGGLDFPEFLSEDARDLIRGMIAFEESARFGWEEIVNHPWCFYDGERALTTASGE